MAPLTLPTAILMALPFSLVLAGLCTVVIGHKIGQSRSDRTVPAGTDAHHGALLPPSQTTSSDDALTTSPGATFGRARPLPVTAPDPAPATTPWRSTPASAWEDTPSEPLPPRTYIPRATNPAAHTTGPVTSRER